MTPTHLDLDKLEEKNYLDYLATGQHAILYCNKCIILIHENELCNNDYTMHYIKEPLIIKCTKQIRVMVKYIINDKGYEPSVCK